MLDASAPPVADAPQTNWSDHLPPDHGMAPDDVATYDALMNGVHGPAPAKFHDLQSPDLTASFGDPFPPGAFKGQAGEALRAHGFTPPSASDAAPVPTDTAAADLQRAMADLHSAHAAAKPAEAPQAPTAATISGSWGTPPSASPGAGAGKQAALPPLDVSEQYRTSDEELRLAKAADEARRESGGAQAQASEKYGHDIAAMQSQHEQDRKLEEQQALDAGEREKEAFAGQVDPNHRWANADTGERVSTLLGLVFGGFGQAIGHLPTNAAADMVKDQIHNDIDVQKFNQENKEKGAQLGVANVERHMQRGADDLKAKQLAMRDGYDQAILQAKMTAEQSGSDPSEMISALKDRQALDEHVLQAEIATKRLAGGKHPVNVGIVGGPPTGGSVGAAPGADGAPGAGSGSATGPSPQDIAEGNVPGAHAAPNTPEGIDYLKSVLKPEFGGAAEAKAAHAAAHGMAPHINPPAGGYGSGGAGQSGPPSPAAAAPPPPPGTPAAVQQAAAAPVPSGPAGQGEHWIVDDAGRTGKTHEEQMAHVDAHNQGLTITSIPPRKGGPLPYDQYQPGKTSEATIVRVAPSAPIQKQLERTIPLYTAAATDAQNLDRQLASKDLYSAALSFQSMKLKWLAAVQGGGGKSPGLGMLEQFNKTFDPDHLLDSADPTSLKHWIERATERGLDKGGVTIMRNNLRNVYKEIQDGHRDELGLAPEKAYVTDERGRMVWLKK